MLQALVTNTQLYTIQNTDFDFKLLSSLASGYLQDYLPQIDQGRADINTVPNSNYHMEHFSNGDLDGIIPSFRKAVKMERMVNIAYLYW